MTRKTGLALRSISGHCTVTADRIHAWYLLEPQGWSFRPDGVREQLIRDGADCYAQLVRRNVHIRVTTRPYPVSEWASAHDGNAPAPLPGWRDYLMRDQEHLAGRNMSDKEVYLGVEIPARKGLYRIAGALAGALSDREVAGLGKAIRETSEIMAAPGMDAIPATPRQLEWLLHRSTGLGLPAPLTLGNADAEQWDTEDLAEFTDTVQWHTRPYGRTILVTGEANGEMVERHVCVMSVGRMGDMDIPSGTPWMQRTDALGFPVEWSARVDVEDAAKVGSAMRHAIQKVRSQKEHYEQEHREPAPGALDRQASRALAVEDDLATGLSGLSTRTTGYFRVSVSGATQEEALERANEVRKLYQPGISICRPADQLAVGREFIPGEPLGSTAYRRRMPVTTLSAAVPAATAKVGDRRGIHLGETSGTSQRVVTWEPWEATERKEESGLGVVVAGLGGGKSTAGGNVIYRSLMQGVPWTVLDPSGRLTALCRLPELADHSQAVDLLEAPEGVLNTYRVIAEPAVEHYDTKAEWAAAVERAYETRRMLTTSVLRSMLPKQMQDHVLTEVALLRAVGQVHATSTSAPNYVLDALRDLGGDPDLVRHAGYMRDFYLEAAKTSHGRLIFPSGYYLDKAQAAPLLTVYSLRGLALPDDASGGTDDLDERLSMAVLFLAAWLAQRGMYAGDVHARKGIFLDEAWALGTFSAGRRFIDRASRDSRKHNTRVLLASQNPSDLLRLDLANLVSAAFIGRLTDEQAQHDALQLLPGVAEGVGYEGIFGTLSRPTSKGKRGAREFVFSDGASIERIRMDMAAHPHLLEALSTTADPDKARNRLARLHSVEVA
jgi:hypothetical protein